jgi:hypothetical protein
MDLRQFFTASHTVMYKASVCNGSNSPKNTRMLWAKRRRVSELGKKQRKKKEEEKRKKKRRA